MEKYEFNIGDVLIEIGEDEKMYVYAADDDFYYISSLGNGYPCVFPRSECEEKFVAVGNMTDEEAYAEINMNVSKKK